MLREGNSPQVGLQVMLLQFLEWFSITSTICTVESSGVINMWLNQCIYDSLAPDRCPGNPGACICIIEVRTIGVGLHSCFSVISYSHHKCIVRYASKYQYMYLHSPSGSST